MESIAAWVAPVATTIAALMTASNLGTRITGWGFFVFLIGSLAWMLLGLNGDDPSLIWQNAILSLLNLLGMWRWLGRQARLEQGGEAAAEASADLPSETLFPVSLLGKASVVGAGGRLGIAIDAMAGCRSGRLSYLVVADGGVAGVGETLRRLDWGGVSAEGDQLVTALDSAGFDRLPILPKNAWPGR